VLDVNVVHSKVQELTLEYDFLADALSKVGLLSVNQ